MLAGITQEQAFALLGVVFGAIAVVGIISLLLRIFVFNPLTVGGYRFFRRNNEDTRVGAGVISEGFGGYGHTFVTMFLRDLFTDLWLLLFIIPGIVKSYSYMLVPYLIKDEPELTATEVIGRSKELMNGHKWEAFVCQRSVCSR